MAVMLDFILVGLAVVVILLGFPVTLYLVLFPKEDLDLRALSPRADELAKCGIKVGKLTWIRKV